MKREAWGTGRVLRELKRSFRCGPSRGIGGEETWRPWDRYGGGGGGGGWRFRGADACVWEAGWVTYCVGAAGCQGRGREE